MANGSNGTATELTVIIPFEEFEMKGTTSDVMNWVNARLDDGAKSVELSRRMKQGKRQLIARVWWTHA